MKCYRDLFKEKKVKSMNIKMTINSQLSTIEFKQTKQISRIGTESQYGDHLEGY